MIDERNLLERALHHFEPQPGLTERIYRRRERKRRNERIRAGVVGIVIALIAVLIGTSIVRSEPTPASPHPLPPAPRHADLTFSDDAGIVAIDLASGRRHVVAPGVSAAAVSWSPDGSALVYESTTGVVLGSHPRYRDGRGSRPCELRLTHALRRERGLVRGRRMDRVLDVIQSVGRGAWVGGSS